ncbi:MAG: BrnA antitoxin family protein [Rhizobium sp.]|uniref:BrnA antitoxin family protein n=1 Tax=Ciceribacter sp. T2.26MG-112.2 TaxID=3137154 RepID=UPI000E166033|nr:BrnA antitoxin family protein [Ciceribacter naphthalenivorans]MBC7311001.1 BrnA antitoxin family protein [Rhizobium sp.]SSC72582.1 unnamed protein product [Ciceribacter naphthalenivorans]
MPISQTRLKELASRSDKQIDYSDIPELDEAFFEKAQLVRPAADKRQITIRIDADVLDWFRGQGKGYQTHMNAVLKAYMHSQKP